MDGRCTGMHSLRYCCKRHALLTLARHAHARHAHARYAHARHAHARHAHARHADPKSPEQNPQKLSPRNGGRKACSSDSAEAKSAEHNPQTSSVPLWPHFLCITTCAAAAVRMRRACFPCRVAPMSARCRDCVEIASRLRAR